MSMIQTNPAVLSEPTIRLFLTRLRSTNKPAINPLDPFVLESEFRTKVDVGVGLLPLIWIGSIWRNGRRVDAGQAMQSRSFDIDTSVAKEMFFSATIGGPSGHRLIPPFQYPLGKEAWEIVRFAPVIKIVVSKTCEILIPSIELFRFYYVHSSSTARGLLHGLYRSLISTHEIRGDPDCPEVILKLNWGVRNDDAWVLARYVTSKLMETAASRLHDWIKACNAGGWNKSNILTGTTVFPFMGKTKLTALGTNIIGDDKQERFLVTRLLRCTHPMPFSKVSILVRGNSKGGENDQEILPIYFTKWPGGVIPDVSFGNDEEVDRNMFPTILESNEERFNALTGKKLNKINEESGQLTARVAEGFEKDKTGLGTSEGTSGESNRAPGEIIQKTAVGSVADVTLMNFINALHFIRNKGLKVTTLGIGECVKIAHGERISSFPKQGTSKRQWSVMLGTGNEPRGLVVAEVRKAGKYAYLFEIERDSLRSGDKYSVLVMSNRDYSKIEDEALKAEVTQCAQHGGWKRKSEHREYLREFAPHRYPQRNQVQNLPVADAKLGNRIYSALKRLNIF